MKQGTKVHENLEAQVHEVVQIEIKSREDGWGLRIWNIIQGLRTLRATGLTREFEIWGVIDGQVVNGIIDELSFVCPDQDLEDAIEESNAMKDAPEIPENQLSISDFFKRLNSNVNPWLTNPHPKEPLQKIYITDIKTRGSAKLPARLSMRPTQMQLMLYHRLLVTLATNQVPREEIFSRYKLNPDAPFSDIFVGEIAALEFNFVPEVPEEGGDEHASFNRSEASISELKKYNSLTQLWDLMLEEFSRTIPSADAVGAVLQAEFRSQADGSILGNRTFAYDDDTLTSYVMDEMSWWKGQREARGVDIEEAFKCRICEFAETCEWRIQKMHDAFNKRRSSRKSVMKDADV
jgi:exonuclease V